MDPWMPYFPDAESVAKAEPRIYYPDGPRFSVQGRTVSWMGWDFHADIHGLNGLHISNLRFRDEMMVYELHATEFSAVYSGVSNQKDVYYSDGGYEMGNCATTLKPGLQCPEVRTPPSHHPASMTQHALPVRLHAPPARLLRPHVHTQHATPAVDPFRRRSSSRPWATTRTTSGAKS
jgi:hypothetical protein